MSLAIGSSLGPYDIGELAGRGGMGEVYRARDTRLKRDVAIKILPAEVAADPDRLARFQREAEALAALNHPNIAAIHALEHIAGIRFLVMEFVEGDTLDDRLRHGALYERDATGIAVQICAALSAAHDKGIVHRDLKPANVKVTSAGQVKLLDFGLAKLVGPDDAIDGRSGRLQDLSHSPTMSLGASRLGEIAGTAAYMAPEQARGKPIDKRADIWALGCVIFEMLTGDAPFGGETLTDVVAAIVTKEPALDRLPADTSPRLRWMLTRCFQKDPAARFRDAADVATVLAAMPDAAPSVGRPALARWWVTAGVAAAAALAGAGIVAWLERTPPSTPAVLRFDLPVLRAPVNQPMGVSPDGHAIAYVAATPNNRAALWVRTLDGSDPRMLEGTETDRPFMYPTWSPDGRVIAFSADGKLKKIDAAGGTVETLATLEGQVGGIAWSRAGTILFASNDHGLRIVQQSGGPVTVVSERDASLEETYHDCPAFLPDGRHFLYLGYSEPKPENRAVFVGSLDAKARTRLMASDSCVTYAAPGFIVFMRGQTLMARPFDAAKLAFTGDAVPLVDSVATLANGEVGAFAISDGGTLAFRRSSSQDASRQFVWIDRSGKMSDPIGPVIQTGNPVVRIAPDGKRITFSAGVDSGRDDIWTDDLEHNVRVRLTTDPDIDHVPVWSPDGTRIAFDSHRGGHGSILYEIAASGAVPERVLMPADGNANAAVDWSRDGRYLIFQRSPSGAPPWDLWVLPLVGDGKPFAYRATPADEERAALSPNGRWLAYMTNESSTYQVVVQPFPDPSGGKWQVSSDGGLSPRWRADGRELYFVSTKGSMMAASIAPDRPFEVLKTTTLFRIPAGFDLTQSQGYDVAPDGQRFLFTLPVGNTSPAITVVVNWRSLISERAARSN